MPIAPVRSKLPAASIGMMLAAGIVCLTLGACQSLSREKLLYDRDGVKVGLQPDPSVTRSTPPAPNAHPASLSPEEIAVLLGAVRVSGWSGTLVGYFETPRTIPFLEEADLRLVAAPIAEAFGLAGPSERVFFVLPNPKSPYGDATAAFLFVRNAFMHLVVTDHKAYTRADTAGGDEKDPRDMKGMKLWVAAPYHAAEVPAGQEPDWAPFETVHLSLDRKEILARGQSGPGAMPSQAIEPRPAAPTHAGRSPAPGHAIRESKSAEEPEELRLQIRELTQSNLDLRDRLTQQSQELKDLKEELGRLRRELDRAKPKSPAPKKSVP